MLRAVCVLEGAVVEEEGGVVEVLADADVVGVAALVALEVEGGDGVVLVDAALVAAGVFLYLRGVLDEGGDQAVELVVARVDLVRRERGRQDLALLLHGAARAHDRVLDALEDGAGVLVIALLHFLDAIGVYGHPWRVKLILWHVLDEQIQ